MLKASDRIRTIERHYGRRTLPARQVYLHIERALRQGRAISVIRLGDVMARLLARRDISSLNFISDFLGIPLPPGPRLQAKLISAVHTADIVGLSHYPTSMKYLSLYMKRSGWRPPLIADAFINDLLYEQGYIHQLLRRHRVALVGRAAPAAAAKLRAGGFPVALTVPLDDYSALPAAFRKLARHRDRYDLVLIGASVPGRILCSLTARRLSRTAVEIGHMMDALSKPRTWSRFKDSRRVFKFRWMKKIRARRRQR